MPWELYLNLENISAMLINDKLSQKLRLEKLNEIAIQQLTSLEQNDNIKSLENIKNPPENDKN